MHPDLNRTLAQAHVDERRRRSEVVRRTSPPGERPWPRTGRLFGLIRRSSATPLESAVPADAQVRIRYAGSGDEETLARLAALDEARVPTSPVLLVEVDGEPWAARSLVTDEVVANPFRHTAVLAELLAVRAAQLRAVHGPLDSRLVPRRAAPSN